MLSGGSEAIIEPVGIYRPSCLYWFSKLIYLFSSDFNFLQGWEDLLHAEHFPRETMNLLKLLGLGIV